MAENYSVVMPFEFEREFDPMPSTIWMQKYWMHSITLSALYVIAIHVGQRVMRDRPMFHLKNPLTCWNFALAIFSILGCSRMTPEFFYVLSHFGFQYSMCNASYAWGVTGYWTQMFAMSKVLELGDTAFIILRKRKLMFLHWYHHITVLVYTWHAYKDHTAAGRWFIWMNYSVHAMMYSYYTARSVGWKAPKWIPMSVTSFQISQMFIGCFIALRSYWLKGHGDTCQQTYTNLYFSFSMYATYFLLFAHFFWSTYVRKGNRYSSSEKQE